MKKKERCCLVALQETKCEVFSIWDLKKIWGQDNLDSVFSKSQGASGGTLLIWIPCIFKKESTLVDDNFCGVIGRWNGVENKIGFINVYGPHNSSAKSILWLKLQQIITSGEHIWVIMGDFNAIRHREERVGLSFDARDALNFNNFIHGSGLHDIQMGRRRFTRFSKDGRSMSKLDRFLINQKFLDQWKNVHASALTRTLSDHSPILLKVDELDIGPKPFKIFDHWELKEEFGKLVDSSWKEGQYSGTADQVLKDKLKKLKQDIKSWSKEERLKQLHEKIKLQESILDWDRKAEMGGLSNEDIRKREDDLFNLAQIENAERMELRQKARIKWSMEGDENSRYFHAMVNQRWKKAA